MTRTGAIPALIASLSGVSLLALIPPACAPTGGSPRDCKDTASVSTPCCDLSLFPRVLLTDLVGEPEKYIGKAVEMEGIADWYSDDQDSTECALGHCIIPLGMRSPSCGVSLRLTGVYDGRAVECPENGCYPLIVLQRYAVCGTLLPPDPEFDAQPALRLQAFCPR